MKKFRVKVSQRGAVLGNYETTQIHVGSGSLTFVDLNGEKHDLCILGHDLLEIDIEAVAVGEEEATS
jgi:hypothetical protein